MHSKRYIIGVDNVVDEEEYDQFDELPPFSIGITSSNDDVDDTRYYDNYLIHHAWYSSITSVVERRLRALMHMVHSLLVNTNLPKFTWTEALKTTTQILDKANPKSFSNTLLIFG
ncbi:hypothetical protein LXL04_003967 [Taraxacum kok-saghyz]